MKRVYDVKNSKKKILISLIAILLIVTIFCSFKTIKSGEIGLTILKNFKELI